MSNPKTISCIASKQNDENFDSHLTFQLKEKIGKGQFSIVFKAVSINSNSTVALKKIQILDMINEKARRDCLQEIAFLQLNHPNIIKYYASYIENNELHIILELAEAGDLSKIINRYRHHKQLIPEKTIWKYFLQIALALQYMHSKRIMHRDIKPANIFLTKNEIVKLGDLGLGRFFSIKTIASHSLVGTPYYMSPECINECGYNFKSDIWSLGCLLYELASLQSPFFGENMNLYTLCMKIEICDYPPLPSDLYLQELRNLIASCLRHEPDMRPDINYICKESNKMNDYFQRLN